MDYTNSQIVAFDSGLAKIQDGNFRIIHIIDIDKYQETINSLQNILSQNITKHHFLHPFLTHELTEIQGYLDRLKPNVKNKRSLNFIGSAWKWIAGNPDHDDFEIITQKTNEVLENNNKQVVINKLSLRKINELTQITNEIIKSINYSDVNRDRLSSKLKFKIEILKQEIVNIQYAIHWAKIGIVNSFILSSDEINIIKNIIEKDSIPFVNVEEIFEFAQIKIATNNQSIIYIIRIPMTDNKVCNRLLLKPIKFEKFVNKLKFENVIMCKQDLKLYGIKSECMKYNNISICNSINLEAIENNTCISNLLNSKTSNCTVTDNKTVPTVEEVSPGVILLNNFNETILINNVAQRLIGSYVIQYSNTTLSISDKSYSFFEISHIQPLPAILQPRESVLSIEETLSLESIKEIQISNTKAINLLGGKYEWGQTTNFGLTSFAIILIIVFIIRSKICKRGKEIILTPSIADSCPYDARNRVPMPEVVELPGIRRISHIPYF